MRLWKKPKWINSWYKLKIMDDLLNILLKDIYTLSALRHRIRVLRSYFSKIFFGTADLILNENDIVWINSLPKDFLEKFDKNNTTQKIAELEKTIGQLQPLTVYLPFEANDEAVKLIGGMARKLFNPKLFLDIKYDPRLLAGCALSWKGIYKDYSLHQKITEKKQAISLSFNKFLR